MNARDLHVVEPCLSFVNRMLSVNPKTVFTSGNRTRKDQARAMAQNLVADRDYVSVYAHSYAIDKIREWISSHPLVNTFDGLNAGLLGVLSLLTDDQFAHLTSHANGLAVDIDPTSCTLKQIDSTMQEIAGSVVTMSDSMITYQRGKLILKEGKLSRRHCQFKPLPLAPVSV